MPSHFAGLNVHIAGIKALKTRLTQLTDDTRLLETLRARLADVWARGAQQFVLATVRELATKGKPGSGFVDTGMTAATFWALSKALNAEPYNLKRAIQIIEAKMTNAPRGKQKGVPIFPKGKRDKNRNQTRFEGQRLGKRAYIFTVPLPIVAGSGRQFVFKFSFQTVSWQMAFWDPQFTAITTGIETFEARVAKAFEQQARLVLAAHFKGKTLPKQGIFT